ncbi:MAG: hypothetical protein WBD51_20310, partial [Burkholderiaceae bacterium]
VADDGSGDTGDTGGSGDTGGGDTATGNQLPNPGFEDGTTQPWEQWGSFSVANDASARTGDFAARIPPYNGGGTFVDVSAGSQYRFSGFGYVAGAGGSAQLAVKFFDAGWAELGAPLLSDSFAIGSYSEEAVLVVVPATAVRAQLSIWNGNPNVLVVDDLRFEAITDDGDGGGDTGGGDTGGGDTGGGDTGGGDTGGGDDGGQTGDGSNLAVNGDFETGQLAPWQDWGGLTIASGSNAHGADWYGEIAGGSGGGLLVETTGGQAYDWSAWGQIAGSGSGQMFIKFFAANWSETGSAAAIDGFGNSWQERSGTIVSPTDAAYMQLGFWNNGPSPMRIDDVSIVVSDDSGGGDGGGDSGDGGGSVDTDPTNLITNPGFESGDVAPWEGWSELTAVQVTDAVAGNWVGQAPADNGGGMAAIVVVGRSYTFSGFGRVSSAAGWAGLMVQFFDAQWNVVGSVQRSDGFTSEWSGHTMNFVAPPGAHRVQVAVWNGSGGVMEVDELALRLDSAVTDAALMYYVSPTGVGVSTTRSAPGDVSATIARICDGTLNTIKPGDSINFLDGVYLTSGFNMGYAADGTQAGHGGNGITMLDRNCGGPDYIYLQAENRHGAIILNDVHGQNHSGGFDFRRSSYISVDGFVVQGADTQTVPFERGVSVEDSSHHIVIKNNQLLDIGGGGINVTRSSHLSILGNEIRNAAGQHPYCGSAIN